MGDLLEWTWGKRDLSVLDPFSGGGSIPFESLRYGFSTYANDLNPVAATILKAGLDYPARFGVEFAESIQKWGKRWYELVHPQLEPYYTSPPGEPNRTIYMWARSVACPTTGKPVPLSPNWWISSGENLIAAKLITEPHMEVPHFVIVTGSEAKATNPDEGTIARGVARSPWTGETISGDYIKAEAQAGRMGEVLYCLEVETKNGKEYISPTEHDLQIFRTAEKTFLQKKPFYIGKDLIPSEAIPQGSKTSEPIRYGMRTWDEMFSSRQLFTKSVFSETLHDLETRV